MEFYERLRNLRISRGLTSKGMAAQLGIAPSSYSQYENGKRQPDVMRIKTMSKILDTTGDYLLGLVDNPDEKIIGNYVTLEEDEKQLLKHYRQLNIIGRDKSREYTKDLTENNKYTK